jgi:proline iminopeptidase
VWEQYVAQVPVDERGSFIAAYSRLLNDPDPAVHLPAAVAWSTWESSAITLLPHPERVETFAAPHFALAFARIENHYFMNHGWLEEGQLLANAHLVRDIPTVIVQGRYDICTPPVTAWDLHRALPEAEFVLVPDAGHSFDEPGILSALIEATDRFAR